MNHNIDNEQFSKKTYSSERTKVPSCWAAMRCILGRSARSWLSSGRAWSSEEGSIKHVVAHPEIKTEVSSLRWLCWMSKRDHCWCYCWFKTPKKMDGAYLWGIEDAVGLGSGSKCWSCGTADQHAETAAGGEAPDMCWSVGPAGGFWLLPIFCLWFFANPKRMCVVGSSKSYGHRGSWATTLTYLMTPRRFSVFLFAKAFNNTLWFLRCFWDVFECWKVQPSCFLIIQQSFSRRLNHQLSGHAGNLWPEIVLGFADQGVAFCGPISLDEVVMKTQSNQLV